MSTSRVTIAIDVGGTKVIWEAHRSYRVISQHSASTTTAFAGGRDTFIEMTRRFVHETAADPDGASASVIVVGIPGIVSQSGDLVISCPNLPALNGVELKSELQSSIGVPVDVQNDVNLAALGEYTVGAAKGHENSVCILVGTGIGCGLIINGTLYTGDHGIAGEFGHTIVVPGGVQCSCGRRGCLEMYCSGKAFSRAAGSLLGVSPHEVEDYSGARQLFSVSASGHEGAIEVIRNGFSLFGLALANLANVLDPGAIVLGGGLLSGAEWTWETIVQAYEDNRRAYAPEGSILRRSVLGSRAVIAGGAVQALRLIGG